MNAAQLARMTEPEAREFLESVRWPDGPVCPRCGSTNAAKLGGQAGEKGQHKCKDCRRKFTVRVGTIFEESPLPLRDWVYAFARMCGSKKGISAHQLHRELGVTYKTAWFMCHRVREAMREDGSLKLSGTVESDESYVGGKPRPAQYSGRTGRQGRTDKTPVHTLVERDGRKRTLVLRKVTSKNLRQNLTDGVHHESTIMTDESNKYRGVGRSFKGGHKSVDHSKHEYFRHSDGASTNTAESSFALIKRGVYGTFHHVSAKHLQRYCDEFDFRWNHRKADDGARTVAALENSEGKRLMYRRPQASS